MLVKSISLGIPNKNYQLPFSSKLLYHSTIHNDVDDDFKANILSRNPRILYDCLQSSFYSFVPSFVYSFIHSFELKITRVCKVREPVEILGIPQANNIFTYCYVQTCNGTLTYKHTYMYMYIRILKNIFTYILL